MINYKCVKGLWIKYRMPMIGRRLTMGYKNKIKELEL